MKRLAQLRSVDFADYRDERLDEEASDKTVREELLLCSTILNTARKDWSITVENWVQHVRKPSAGRPRDRRLKGDEEQRMLSACRGCKNLSLEAAVVLAIETGMRRGEIVELTWEQVDLPHKIIKLQLTKNGDSRGVPLSVKAEAVLRKLSPKESGKIFAFHDSNGVGAAFARACTRADIEDLRFHDLRHEAASRKALRMSVAHLAKVMGWGTIQMAMRYYNPHDEELVEIERGESGHGVR
jgi:integrase